MLLISYLFFIYVSQSLVIILFAVTIVTYAAGLNLPRTKGAVQKVLLAVSIIFNLSFLLYFKYAAFFLGLCNSVLEKIHVSLQFNDSFSLILPIGISYYTFKSIGYLIDVYREKVEPERNFLDFALFIGFFVELLTGPIDRATNFLPQLKEKKRFEYDKVKNGLLLMLYGYFLKLVIADRIGLLVDTVYTDIYKYAGFQIVIAVVGYALQIYTDFGGCTAIALGAGQMLGYELPNNFLQPYFATSIADFWRRWHISLTSWFRDYLYIPLGGNRKGNFRKWINVMIIFLVSGLWHGAGLHFIFWGGLNGFYQYLGHFFKPLRDGVVKLFHVDRTTFAHQLYKRIFTFVLAAFMWIFFRAESLRMSLTVIKQMFRNFNPWIFVDGSLYEMGLSNLNWFVLLIALAVCFFVDLGHERGQHFREKLAV